MVLELDIPTLLEELEDLLSAFDHGFLGPLLASGGKPGFAEAAFLVDRDFLRKGPVA
jgi:hypothetical protein